MVDTRFLVAVPMPGSTLTFEGGVAEPLSLPLPLPAPPPLVLVPAVAAAVPAEADRGGVGRGPLPTGDGPTASPLPSLPSPVEGVDVSVMDGTTRTLTLFLVPGEAAPYSTLSRLL